MQIAILGGTGDLGGGLALRLAADTDHEVVVGSRDPERADEAARSYGETLAERGLDGTVRGEHNPDAAGGAEVVVLAVPAEPVVETVESVADRVAEDAIVVSPAVGLEPHEAGFRARAPHAESETSGSVAQLVANATPEAVPVVGAFHTLAAGRLASLDDPLDVDALVVGDDADARATVAGLAEEIDGLRAIDAGPLANAPGVESLTALQLTLMRQNPELDDVGVQFR